MGIVIVIILNLFILLRKEKNSELSQIKQLFNKSQLEQNYEVLNRITKDSGELSLKLTKSISNNSEKMNKEITEFKDNFTTQITKEYGELKLELSKNISSNNEKLNKDINEFRNSLNTQITKDFKSLNSEVEKQLTRINEKVEERLNEGFEKTTKTFNNILERISKIDEAQKKIEQLSTNIVDLQSVLTDKKSRGTFGEVQLNQILSSIFGDNNKKIYELQRKMSNGTMVDAIIYGPEPLGNICIDSKFPLENYQRMVDRSLPDMERNIATKKFKDDVKKHINDISEKYIVPGETSEQAIMFIPAEAVFAEINAYHPDIIVHSQNKKVALTSPTTIMSMLTIIQAVLRDIERDKHAKVIQDELGKLGDDFNRYKKRWDDLSKTIDTVTKRVKDVHTTSNKISRRFSEISQVEIETEVIDTEKK
ncbi:DNA recombination protein RmuC [Mycoplasmatota bacterium]|nr:DNA recombination protein RmuC [Mycoplasmatota bacterium]